MILVLAGTKDGRELAEALVRSGEEVCLCSVSEYASSLAGPLAGLRLHSGALDADGIADLAGETGAELIADASHPYAKAATENAVSAARRLGIPVVRLQRPGAGFDDSDFGFDTPEALARALSGWLESNYGRVLFTTGSNNLPDWQLVPLNRQVIRVLPTSRVLEKCESLGYSPGQIIAEQGPFSTEQNLLTFNKYEICALVTKDSGKIGGTPEKLEAAREADVQVFYLKRPAFPNLRTGSTPDEVCGIIRRRLGRD